MERDRIDELIGHWQRERPDLDPQPMAVVGRILRLSGYLERRVNDTLKPFGLAVWGFDVLATLRRHGEPFAMAPKELMQATMLSSGAMTNRIDRLEESGLVERVPDPDDRRSVRVRLTRKGRSVIDKAIAARFQEADEALQSLPKRDRKQLADLLRTLLVDLETET
ncbi:MarR family transcriptional regulator [Maioricimonas sp. JC845]|uniref:MarR family winged helix-turn-helix transcriptional regulator n=1 Tax=Maioricimonas sp. JC845 TaxID=3232138 RepID=UPI00345B44B1